MPVTSTSAGKTELTNVLCIAKGSSIFTLKRYALLEEAKITHVVSIVSQNIEPELVKNYKHLAFNLDDVDYEDILQHFPKSNAFIKEALIGGGSVLVHW